MMKQTNSRASNTAQEHDYRQLSDAACKQLLADKLILACILKGCIPEFRQCHVNDIETKYIEGEPEISTVSVHPDTTNKKGRKRAKGSKIQGMTNESTSDSEGCVTFDIRFFAVTPTEERVKLIINVEAQNRFNPGYPLIKRGIYYGCRQISAQYGVEFEKAEYENIKKVYSIWICFNPPEERRNTITMYHIAEKHIVGKVHEDVENYDLMTVVMICLGTKKDKRYTGLLRFLDVFMSETSDAKRKQSVLKTVFGADMPERLRIKEGNMCNYSDFIEERGIDKGIRKGKVEDLCNLMKNFKLTLEQAFQGLSIPEDEWDEYRQLVKEFEAQTAH